MENCVEYKIKELLNIAGYISLPFYLQEYYCLGIIKRSNSILNGFQILLNQKLFNVAFSLVRLQIDNLLRFRALSLVDDEVRFLIKILVNKQKIENLTDRDNKQMKDFYLRKKFSKDYFWLDDLYSETSGYIHFSASHFNKLTGVLDEDFIINLSADEMFIEEFEKNKIIDSMVTVTDSLSDSLKEYINLRESQK